MYVCNCTYIPTNTYFFTYECGNLLNIKSKLTMGAKVFKHPGTKTVQLYKINGLFIQNLV